MIRQEHPTGEKLVFRLPLSRGQVVRKIAKSCVGIEKAICIKTRWKQGDAAFKIEVHSDPGRARIPIIAVVVLECVAVTCTVYEPAGLIRDRVVWSVREWPQRSIANIGAIGV